MPTDNETDEWYTVCSKPHTNYNLYVAVVGSATIRRKRATSPADAAMSIPPPR